MRSGPTSSNLLFWLASLLWVTLPAITTAELLPSGESARLRPVASSDWPFEQRRTPSGGNQPGGFWPFQEEFKAVREMEPMGYWPANEGQGELLHDQSGRDNNGRVFNVPWVNGLLEFNGSFQWVEIPNDLRYHSSAFTIGGWIFIHPRTSDAPSETNSFFFIGNSYHSSWGWRDVGNRYDDGFLILVSENLAVEIVSGGKRDALDSVGNNVALESGRWEHLIYSYSQDGKATLYLNGEEAASKDQVPFQHTHRPYLMGNDQQFWERVTSHSRSLDGSISQVVLFGRELSAEEVQALYNATRPTEEPTVFEDHEVVRIPSSPPLFRSGARTPAIQVLEIPLTELPNAPVEERHRALTHLREEGFEDVPFEELLPALATSLEDWETRQAATHLLMRMYNRQQAGSVVREAAPRFLRVLQDERVSEQERAATVLALLEMGGNAPHDTLPTFLSLLEGILRSEGERVPRINDLLRNALIRGVLDLGRGGERERRVLESALARPMMEALDLSPSHLDGVRGLVEQGRYWEAMQAFQNLSPADHGEHFFSTGGPERLGYWAYTPTAKKDGYHYEVGPPGGRDWERSETISREEYQRVAAELERDYPNQNRWMYARSNQLGRVNIAQTDPEGNVTRVTLEGDWFIFHQGPKMEGWSIDVDRKGYIHVIGGMHGWPNEDYYIPGSWEKMGLARERHAPNRPSAMYWVSRNPHDLTSLEFVGQSNNPRNIPVRGWGEGIGYMTFARDQDGDLYLYGRTYALRKYGWGLARYDPERRRWTALGGFVPDLFADVQASNPGWINRLTTPGTDGEPWDTRATHPREALVWSWLPSHYNFCRDHWGVRFDLENRMHVVMQIRGLDGDGRILDSSIYAYSDDKGDTFHRADGSRAQTPLTLNPAPSHMADIHSHHSYEWWNLWHSLLQEAGFHYRRRF